MTEEVITSYTETGDDGVPGTGILTETSSEAGFTGLNSNVNICLSKNFGAGYFANSAYAESKFRIASLAPSNATVRYMQFGFGDTAGSLQQSSNVAMGEVGVSNGVFNLYATLGESAVYTADTSSYHPSIGTDYYARYGFLSSIGGQYGAVFVQFFSDVNFASYLGGANKKRNVGNTYSHFLPIQSNNSANANGLTGTNANINLFAPAAGINLTTGTETDPNTKIALYADCITATGLSVYSTINGATHTAHDYGAGTFADYRLSGVLNITSFTNGAVGAKMFDILAVTDAASDALAANDLQGISINWVSATTFTLYIHQALTGTDSYSSVSSTLNTNQPYSCVLERSGTTLTLKVFNDLVLTDFTGTSQVGTTVTWTGRASSTYRYLMPVSTDLFGTTDRNSTFTIGGVKVLGSVITATKGAFNWAGKTSTISEQPTSINITKGAFSWAGKSSPLSLMIQATKGQFSWAGKTVNLNTGGQVNTTPGAFSWAGKTSPLSHIIAASKGAFSWAGKSVLIGATVTSLRTATLIKWDSATGKEIPDTGLTSVLYMLYDPTNLKVFDFSDNTFKASTSCVTPRGTMTERVLLDSGGTNLTPGIYDILLATTGLSGLYQEYLFYYGATNHLDSKPVRFQDGVEYLGGLTVSENTTLNAVPSNVWDEVLTKATHNVTNSAGKILRQLRGMTILEGTATAGGTNTITLDSGASSVNSVYKEALIVIVAGTAAGEAHHIVSYNGTTKIAVVDQNWYVTPDNTSDYLLFGGSVHDTTESGLAQAGASTSITLNGTASTIDNIYVDQMIYIPSGTGVGQVRRITGYVGATKVATVDKTWTITPDNTSAYMLYPAAIFSVDVKKMNAATVTGNGTSGDLWRGA